MLQQDKKEYAASFDIFLFCTVHILFFCLFVQNAFPDSYFTR